MGLLSGIKESFQSSADRLFDDVKEDYEEKHSDIEYLSENDKYEAEK